MLTALLAVKNILGEHHDLWNVNTERSYHEELMTKKDSTNQASQEASQLSSALP
jgi:hypothetical protein